MFKSGLKDEQLTREIGKPKPRTMMDLMNVVTNLCSGEDAWNAKQKMHEDPSMSGMKDEYGRP